MDVYKTIKGLDVRLKKIEKEIEELKEREDSKPFLLVQESSLREFIEDEPDLYTLKDLKVRYRRKAKLF
ncbi:MAG: hypothetical protein JW778_01790 [Candidatus Altiarchaeota archaeon]|nr:hypothetical protein [Candidatus Altiarchaeota archaeon]